MSHLPNPFAPGHLLDMAPWQKIQARSVSGRYTRLRWAFVWLTQLAFYGLPWLSWAGRPALLFDLEHRRFFVFGAVFFPQDMIWLTALLIASALLLFFVTTLVGRVWCGFACPQTVYTELFSWIERRCEGDRLARQRLDAAPWGARKLLRRGGKHLAWGLLGLWTGLSLVGYFTPVRELLAALPAGALGAWELFWILFYGAATYLHAGWLREKVCQHACPYGRFQGAMLDSRTLNVAYDAARGEPRGGRARQADARALGLGSCVDCTLCVQVCPVGIDIRAGFQAACINCGACIDACDTVMDKTGQPRGLIRFASLEGLAQARPQQAARPLTAEKATPRPGLWRPRVLVYGSLLLATVVALGLGLLQRPTLRMDAMRDRAVLAREVEDGAIENTYQVLLLNARDGERAAALQVVADPALPGLTVVSDPRVRLPAADSQTVLLRLRLPAEAAQRLRGRILPVTLQARTLEPAPEAARTRTTFVLPR